MKPLVSFQKTLPLIRAPSRTQTPLQALQKIKVQPGMLPQKVVQQPSSTARTSSPQISSPQVMQAPQQQRNAHIQPNHPPQQIVIQKPLTGLTQAQLLQQSRQLPSGQRVIVSTTGALPSGTQLINTTRGLMMVRSATVSSLAPGTKGHIITSSTTASEKLKHKSSFTGISR